MDNYKFSPDEELIEFADFFSSNYDKLDWGKYYSVNKKYQIDFLERIKGDELMNTDARISKNTAVIEISDFIVKKRGYNKNFIFFIVLWCAARKELLDHGVNDDIRADSETLWYYITTGRSVKDVYMGFKQMVKSKPTKLNNMRYKFAKLITLIKRLIWK